MRKTLNQKREEALARVRKGISILCERAECYKNPLDLFESDVATEVYTLAALKNIKIPEVSKSGLSWLWRAGESEVKTQIIAAGFDWHTRVLQRNKLSDIQKNAETAQSLKPGLSFRSRVPTKEEVVEEKPRLKKGQQHSWQMRRNVKTAEKHSPLNRDKK